MTMEESDSEKMTLTFNIAPLLAFYLSVSLLRVDDIASGILIKTGWMRRKG
jgi:hypothetical protein